MIIRKTKEADLAAIGEIYENAKRFMRECGNPNQWNGSRPSAISDAPYFLSLDTTVEHENFQ